MSYPTCENCHKIVATVTVIEIPPGPPVENKATHTQLHLCELCAQSKDLPHAPVVKNAFGNIWKLLKSSGGQAQHREQLECPDCGMTSEELRNRGRIGCARDYEIFADDIGDILERVHGAKKHTGRIPGVSSEELDRMQTVSTLRRELDAAIREEAYENAARIRDELQALGESA